MIGPHHRLALYMEGALGEPEGKMGYGLLRYSPHAIVCVVDSRYAGHDQREITGIPRSVPVVASLEEARACGADVLVLAIAPSGGLLPAEWRPAVDEAVERGFSLVNGLHDRLAERYRNLRPGQFVWDIRVEPPGLGVATGRAARLPNRRVLMIGADMAIGKMTAGLEIDACARARGLRTAFVATGQIGIAIRGEGVPLDAIRVDYACGAVERQVLRHAGAELIVVEGQGALNHPGSTSSLPLLRGACPTHLVFCARAGQTHLKRLPDIPIPPLRQLFDLWEQLATTCGLFPAARVAGVALNTAGLSEEEATRISLRLEDELALPVVDPVREGAGRLLDAVLA